jgi:hypothetical protein
MVMAKRQMIKRVSVSVREVRTWRIWIIQNLSLRGGGRT